MNDSPTNSKTATSQITLHGGSDLTRVQAGARQLIFSALNNIKHGALTVVEQFEDSRGSASLVFGDTSCPLHAKVEIRNPDFYKRMLTGGSIGAGEAYMEGWWSSNDLPKVMELMGLNLSSLDSVDRHSGLLKRFAYKMGHWLNRNTRINSKKNIEAHYDLGNDFYQLFLDSNMLYSSGLYLSPEESLEQAQTNKMARLCRELQLSTNDHVLEIGTGWGAMAIYMAQNFGCRVTTTTISEEQHAFAKQRIQELGLQGQITLLKQDYRDLEGEYDKVVSIEMIEAVGKEFLDSYLQTCDRLLKPGGIMAIQSITIADQRFEHYSNSVDFIQKYVFPGGFLPSVSALLQHSTRSSNLVIRNLHDMGIDYAYTLADWFKRFEAQLETVRTLGYDERFIRMWRYYLGYCEGGFKAQSISAVQITFSKPV